MSLAILKLYIHFSSDKPMMTLCTGPCHGLVDRVE